MRIVVDRFEGSMAVLDVGGRQVNFPAAALPEGATEGAVLELSLDSASEKAIRERGEARLERLRERTEAASSSDDDVFEL